MIYAHNIQSTSSGMYSIPKNEEKKEGRGRGATLLWNDAAAQAGWSHGGAAQGEAHGAELGDGSNPNSGPLVRGGDESRARGWGWGV